MVSTRSISAPDLQSIPTLTSFPFQANGVVLTYNLPMAASNAHSFALSGATLCRIFRGNITRWNDPAIVASNPSMALGTAAGDRPITLMLVGVSSTHSTFTTYCRKIDPIFKATIAAGPSPVYPINLQKTFVDIDLMNSAVSDTPYSLAMTTLTNAASISLPIAGHINAEGKTIFPTANSMSLNLFELATNGFTPVGGTSYDLSNPGTAQAWPMMIMTYGQTT
jgi:phosphate transport system substrate-binding protein